ncbi:YdeI/OmpD-associated family protein [Ilumatobacter sp.]
MLRWIAGAKREATRAKRIDIVAAHAARGEKVPNY